MPRTRLNDDPIPTKINYADEAERRIRTAVVSGILPPGSRHSVDGIRQELNLWVSRTPVREALVRLAEAGMVSFESNQGVRILEQDAEDLQELFEIRIMLEVPATYHAAAHIDEETRGALKFELDEMFRIAELSGALPAEKMPNSEEFQDLVVEFLQHDKEFHQIILSAGGNERLAGLVGNLRDFVTTQGSSTLGRLTRSLTEVAREHSPIYEALNDGKEVEAAGAMYLHLAHTGDELTNELARKKGVEIRRRLRAPWFESEFRVQDRGGIE